MFLEEEKKTNKKIVKLLVVASLVEITKGIAYCLTIIGMIIGVQNILIGIRKIKIGKSIQRLSMYDDVEEYKKIINDMVYCCKVSIILGIIAPIFYFISLKI